MRHSVISDGTTLFESVGVMATGKGAGGGGGHGGGGGGHGGGNSGSHGGGNSGGGSSSTGDLYGDQIVMLRDLDPSDGGGNGEPVLDGYNTEPQPVVVGYDPTGELRPDDADGYFPITFEMIAEGDYEIPAAFLPYVQEVELERANVARAPAKVMEKALDEAVGKLLDADVVQTDTAGRLMYSTDGGATFLTIDSPLENLALYQALLTAGSEGSWSSAQDGWSAVTVGGQAVDLSFLATLEGFDVAGLLGAAWAKEGQITLDALLYENTTLGINTVSTSAGEPVVEYFSFTDGVAETYDYIRSEHYADTWLRWIEIDTETNTPYFAYGTVLDAVFGGADWGAAQDTYLAIDTMGNTDPTDDDFIFVDASGSGVNDFAQAADDARAVIEFIHATSAVEVDISAVPPEYLLV